MVETIKAQQQPALIGTLVKIFESRYPVNIVRLETISLMY
jgi:hypothetical protein